VKARKTAFTDGQRELLTQVLDRIVPSDGGLLGAGELGAGEYVESAVAGSPPQTRLFIDGLAQIAIAGHESQSAGFADLSDERKDEVLRAVESAEPEFFEELVRHTYIGYYSDLRVVAALGLEARPPHPLGYEMEPGDLSALENVRKRGPIYREVKT
jgi:hypothetical protein